MLGFGVPAGKSRWWTCMGRASSRVWKVRAAAPQHPEHCGGRGIGRCHDQRDRSQASLREGLAGVGPLLPRASGGCRASAAAATGTLGANADAVLCHPCGLVERSGALCPNVPCHRLAASEERECWMWRP